MVTQGGARMAYTQEEIKAMEPKALEVELAIQLFGFRWWSEAGITRHLVDPIDASKYVFKELYVWDDAAVGLPLSLHAFNFVPQYATWEDVEKVIAAMEGRGWYWNVGQRVIHIAGARLELEWYAAFRQSAQIGAKIRVMATPTSAGLPMATAQAALWTLQPWENSSNE